MRIVNIALVPTLAGPAREAGKNEIYVWFLQAPEGKPAAPGVARVAVIPVVLKGLTRTPPDRIISLTDDLLALLQ